MVPASRYALFITLALTAAAVDLYSKHAVFEDLGYPGPRLNLPHLVDSPGRHERFQPRHDGDAIVEGVSTAYLDGWLGFRLYTNFNEGALWGLGQGGSWLFASLTVVAICGVVYWLFFHGAAVSIWLTCALALVTGGALGNFYDRLGLHGCVDATGSTRYAVRDFLLFTFGGWHWPVFNFADVFLVTGAIMLVLQSLFTPEPRTAEEAPAADDAATASAP